VNTGDIINVVETAAIDGSDYVNQSVKMMPSFELLIA
jgi:hypothetical protein